MLAAKNANPFAKTALSISDLPDGRTDAETVEILRQGIVELLDCLRGIPEEMTLPGVQITDRDLILLKFVSVGEALFARGRVEDFLYPNGEAALVTKGMVNRLNKKIAPYNVELSIVNRIFVFDGDADGYVNLRNQLNANLRVHWPQLEKIMRPYSINAHIADLPRDIPTLQRMALDLLNLLRGGPGDIELPGVRLTPAEKVLFKATLVKPELVIWDRLELALYTPFASEWPESNALSQRASSLRKKAAQANIKITKYGHRGFTIDNQNLQKLKNYGITPG